MNLNTIRVAYFLAAKRTKRSGILTNLLVIFIMVLTFLNLIFIRGILIGLPQGVVDANEQKYYGDLYISKLDDKKHIIKPKQVIADVAKNPNVQDFSVRYVMAGKVTKNFDARIASEEVLDTAAALVVGITKEDEIETTNITESITKGRLFSRGSTNEIVLGEDLLSGISIEEANGGDTLENVSLGDTVELTVNMVKKEVTVVGFIRTKVSEIDSSVIVSKSLLEDFIDRNDFKPREIAIKLSDRSLINVTKAQLKEKGIHAYAKIETPTEYQPTFVEEIITTFSILGDLIGTIGLVVASITIFIIIFVTAITKKRFIGILKGIGIAAEAIELSYVMQAIFYALIGTIVGLAILYGGLVPYFIKNPIDFPFADGILVAPFADTMQRTFALYIATSIAGYIPARYVVKQNTLDAIVGR